MGGKLGSRLKNNNYEITSWETKELSLKSITRFVKTNLRHVIERGYNSDPPPPTQCNFHEKDNLL